MSIPTRAIIILAVTPPQINYVLRADVPSGQEAFYAQPGIVSPTGNATDPDLPFLVTGAIAQTVESIEIPKLAGETGAQYRTRSQTLLQAQWAGYQQRVSGAAPRAFFGAFWNGVTWTSSGG